VHGHVGACGEALAPEAVGAPVGAALPGARSCRSRCPERWRRRSGVAGDAPHAWACRLFGVSDDRVRGWRTRLRTVGTLEDRAPGGVALHALTPVEIDAVLAVAEEWGESTGPTASSPTAAPMSGGWVSPSTFGVFWLLTDWCCPNRRSVTRHPRSATRWRKRTSRSPLRSRRRRRRVLRLPRHGRSWCGCSDRSTSSPRLDNRSPPIGRGRWSPPCDWHKTAATPPGLVPVPRCGDWTSPASQQHGRAIATCSMSRASRSATRTSRRTSSSHMRVGSTSTGALRIGWRQNLPVLRAPVPRPVDTQPPRSHPARLEAPGYRTTRRPGREGAARWLRSRRGEPGRREPT